MFRIASRLCYVFVLESLRDTVCMFATHYVFVLSVQRVLLAWYLGMVCVRTESRKHIMRIVAGYVLVLRVQFKTYCVGFRWVCVCFDLEYRRCSRDSLATSPRHIKLQHLVVFVRDLRHNISQSISLF
jgi:hypothetical protein